MTQHDMGNENLIWMALSNSKSFSFEYFWGPTVPRKRGVVQLLFLALLGS